jgi:hypothetical protein
MPNTAAVSNQTKISPISREVKRDLPPQQMSTLKKVIIIAVSVLLGALLATVGLIPAVLAVVGKAGIIGIGIGGATLGLVTGLAIITKLSAKVKSGSFAQLTDQASGKTGKDGKAFAPNPSKIEEIAKDIELSEEDQAKLEEAVLKKYKEIKADPEAVFNLMLENFKNLDLLVTILREMTVDEVRALFSTLLEKEEQKEEQNVEGAEAIWKIMIQLFQRSNEDAADYNKDWDEKNRKILNAICDVHVQKAIALIDDENYSPSKSLYKLVEQIDVVLKAYNFNDSQEAENLFNETFAGIKKALSAFPQVKVQEHLGIHLEKISALDTSSAVQRSIEIVMELQLDSLTQELKIQACAFLFKNAAGSIDQDQLSISQRKCLAVSWLSHKYAPLKFEDEDARMDGLLEKITKKHGVAFFKLNTGAEKNGYFSKFEAEPPIPSLKSADLIFFAGAYLRYILDHSQIRAVAASGFAREVLPLLSHVVKEKSIFETFEKSNQNLLSSLIDSQKDGFQGTLVKKEATNPTKAAALYKSIQDDPGLVADLILCCPPGSLEAIRKAMGSDDERSRYLWPDLIFAKVQSYLKEFDDAENDNARFQLMDQHIESTNPQIFEELCKKMISKKELYLAHLMERLGNFDLDNAEQQKSAELAEKQLEVFLTKATDKAENSLDRDKAKSQKEYTEICEILVQRTIACLDDSANCQRICLSIVKLFRGVCSSTVAENMINQLARAIREKKIAPAFFNFTGTDGNPISHYENFDKKFTRIKKLEGETITTITLYPTTSIKFLVLLTEAYILQGLRETKRENLAHLIIEFNTQFHDLLKYMVSQKTFIKNVEYASTIFVEKSKKGSLVKAAGNSSVVRLLLSATSKSHSYQGTLVREAVKDPENAAKLLKLVRALPSAAHDVLKLCPPKSRSAAWRVLSADQQGALSDLKPIEEVDEGAEKPAAQRGVDKATPAASPATQSKPVADVVKADKKGDSPAAKKSPAKKPANAPAEPTKPAAAPKAAVVAKPTTKADVKAESHDESDDESGGDISALFPGEGNK